MEANTNTKQEGRAGENQDALSKDVQRQRVETRFGISSASAQILKSCWIQSEYRRRWPGSPCLLEDAADFQRSLQPPSSESVSSTPFWPTKLENFANAQAAIVWTPSSKMQIPRRHTSLPSAAGNLVKTRRKIVFEIPLGGTTLWRNSNVGSPSPQAFPR